MLKKQYYLSKAFILCAITVALALGATALAGMFEASFLGTISHWMYFCSGLIFSVIVITVLLNHKIGFGIKYFGTHFLLSYKLERQLYKAGFYSQNKRYVSTPKIYLSFDRDNLSKGILKIQNTIRFHSRLDEVVLSSALGKYIVESHYLTADENWFVYELLNSEISYKQTFNSYEEFKNYNRNIPEYNVFLDKRTVIPLQSSLFVGQTGSGKTYCLYSMILQLLNKHFHPIFYFNDPKDSSIALIGSLLAPERTATDAKGIIKNFETFVNEMRDCKKELKEYQKHRMDSDYSDFCMLPRVFIIDEYSSFSAELTTMDKKTRDYFKSLLYEVIQQGRQPGFFVFLIMQQSHSSLLDTALRENLTFKTVLGNSERQTYVTAFGDGVKIPNRNFKAGEGVFTEPRIAPNPKLVQYPYLNFEILEALEGEQG